MSPTEGSSQQSCSNMISCYNKGCGKKFDPKDNSGDSCVYHPGPPYFHDAYKIWNCCQKKSTDFGMWMSYPGCAKGKHSGVKPVDVVKVAAVKEIRPEKEEDVIVWNGLNKPAERLADDLRQEMPLLIEITAGARAAVEKHFEQASESVINVLTIGTPCRNNACSNVYCGPESETEECLHHPGQAIFHEGMKYWSCCKKKTSNFNAFLEQAGCEKGIHLWRKNERVDKVKEDWFSSNGCITVNIYCRGVLPDDICVMSDGQLLRVNLKHGFGAKETGLMYELWGRIIPEDSKVIVGERKVEVILKQRDMKGWPRLKYEPELDPEARAAAESSA